MSSITRTKFCDCVYTYDNILKLTEVQWNIHGVTPHERAIELYLAEIKQILIEVEVGLSSSSYIIKYR